MKKKEIAVSKITIQLGDKEATLTVEQARELQAALNALLGEKVVERVVEKEVHHSPWYPYYYGKVYVGDVPTIPNITTGGITWTSNGTGDFTITLNGDGDLLPV